MRHPSVLLTMIVAALVSTPTLALAWLSLGSRVSPTLGQPTVRDIALDAADDVIGVGVSKGTFRVTKHATASGKVTWSKGLGDGDGERVEVLPGGDVVVAGSLVAPGGLSAVVARLDAGGDLLWSRTFPSSLTSGPAVTGLVVDGTSVFAAWSTGTSTGVARLDAATGSNVWLRTLADEAGGALALDPEGFVVVASESTAGNELRVTKLDAADGSDVWQVTHLPAGVDAGVPGLTLDAAGDVLVARDVSVMKLAATTGAELWRNETLSPAPTTRRVAIDAAGDVITAAPLTDEVPLAKLAGDDGAELWDADSGGPFVLRPDGDVLVLSSFAHLRRIDGATGDALWQHGIVHELITANDLALGSRALAGAGSLQTAPTEQVTATFAVASRIAGRALTILDDPKRHSLTLQLKDALLTPPAFSSINPANPRDNGNSVVEIRNPVTLETATFPIFDVDDPSNVSWYGVTTAGRELYRYKKLSPPGACSMLLKHGSLTLKCSTDLGGLTLDELDQESLEVRITFGSGHPLCADFGGLVQVDAPGVYRAKNAAPPPACEDAF